MFTHSKSILFAAAWLSACSGGQDKKEEASVGGSGDVQGIPAGGAQAFEDSSDLPACAEGNDGLMYWVEEENAFAICRDGNYRFLDLAGSDGEDGIAGEDGKDGADGEAGEDGKDGEDATSPFGDELLTEVLDQNGVFLGFRVEEGNILNVGAGEVVLFLGNGGIGKFDLAAGSFVNSVSIRAADGALDSQTHCAFTSNDCSGSCYLNGDTHKPLRNAVFSSPGGFLKAMGNEQDAGPQMINSILTQGACSGVSGVMINSSYLVANGYLPPAGTTFPLAVPLVFRSYD